MDPKTVQACLQDKIGRHRLTTQKYIKKQIVRIASQENAHRKGARTKAKRKKPAKGKKVKYSRLTEKKRIQIETLWRQKYSQAAIARIVSCNRSTVKREIDRNKSQKGYRHGKAQKKADRRMKEKAAARRKLTPEIWQDAKEKLKKGWTFEQISERAKRDGKPTVSKETFYKEYYYRQRLVIKGASTEELPLLPRRCKLRKTRDRNAKKYRNAGRGKIKDRVDIDQRPKEINNRTRIGHWEGDLINGNHGTGNLATLSERMSRFTLVAYVATKESDAVMAVMASLLKNLPPEILKTLTFDNGKEFALFKILRDEFGLDVYFAKPYHSWERGTNENRNGIVRRVLPKGTDFTAITPEQMTRIDHLLNDRPMKCLGWRTPREVFMARLSYYLKAV